MKIFLKRQVSKNPHKNKDIRFRENCNYKASSFLGKLASWVRDQLKENQLLSWHDLLAISQNRPCNLNWLLLFLYIIILPIPIYIDTIVQKLGELFLAIIGTLILYIANKIGNNLFSYFLGFVFQWP